MIKLEHVVLASPEQMEFIIEGMRNPMNSWEKSDTDWFKVNDKEDSKSYIDHDEVNDMYYLIGHNDLDLMQRLANAGTDHRKFMRMMPVYVRITAPLYWWKEFDIRNIQEKEFTIEDQTRNVMLNYEVLANIYKSRKNHKLDEWREFCQWIESLPYSELITECCIKSDTNMEIIDAMTTGKK